MLFSSYPIEGTYHRDDLPLVVLMPIIWQRQYFKGFWTLTPLLFLLSTLFSFNNHTVCSPPWRGGELRSIPWRVDHLHKLSGILPHRFVLVSHLFLFSTIYVFPYLHIDYYFMFWVIIRYYFIFCSEDPSSAIASSFSHFFCPFDTSPLL